MNDLKTYTDRLHAALERVAHRTQATTNAATVLEQENETLRARLQTLQNQRETDLATLDALLEQLRPLMDEDANA